MIDQQLYDQFRNSYSQLNLVTGQEITNEDGIQYQYHINSPDLRPGNGPRIFHHGKVRLMMKNSLYLHKVKLTLD